MSARLDFEAVFNASPNPYMVLDRDLRYVAANQAYLNVTSWRREDLIGARLIEVFPHDPEDPNNENARRLVASLERVLHTGQPDVLPLIHYRILVHHPEGASYEDHYWSATHTPLLDASGQVEFILQHTVNVTELNRQRLEGRTSLASAPAPAQVEAGILGRAELVQQRNEALAQELRRMLCILEQAPGFLCFLRGPHHVYEFANASYYQLVGHRELIGRPIREALPEIGETYFGLLDQVFESGEPFVGRSMKVPLQRSTQGPVQEVFVDFVFQPILDAEGKSLGIFVLGQDMTQQRRAEAEREANFREAQAARAEASRLNTWLQSAFTQAPVAITLLRGSSYVIELANARVCEIWGRPQARVLKRPLFEALPEIAGQGLEELLDGVRLSGMPYVGTNVLVKVARAAGGQLEDVWFNFVYQPLKDSAGRVDSVVVVASEVTEEFLSRRKLEAAQAELEAIFESFPEALVVGDAGGIKRANATARELLGYDSQEQVLRRQQELAAELQPRRADTGAPLAAGDTPFSRALRGQETRQELIIKRWKTKEDRYVFASGAPIRVGGATTGAVMTLIDVTEQKRAQTEVLQLARMLNAARDFVGIADLTGRPTFVNEAALQLMGLPDLKAALALPVVEYFVERQRPRVLEEVLPTALREGYWAGELLFRHQRTGEEIPVLYSVFPLRDGAGNITSLATITRDLRAQKAAEAERATLLENERAARAQAEQANLLKDQFLATVSHELRTPLTSMLGWMQMIKSGMLPAEKRERALETVERNARVQAQLIDDLLDVSRIMSGKLALEMEPTDIAAVVSAAVETVRPTAEAKGVRLEVALDSTGLVQGDARRLQQVVWNLLVNAVKFTPKGGWVLLHAERQERSVEILVRDSGVGIPVDFLPHVFERFRQAEGGTARKLGGLGLGLSIVRHVVEAHGGEVRALSEGEGKGATFTVRLPVLVPQGKPMRAPAVPEAGFEAPAALEGLHVLIVDDEEDTREYIRALLQQCKARVTVTTSAAEALAALQRERPDVLLSDIGMPGEDGYSLIQRIRALPEGEGGSTPAVALTAYARTEDRTRAIRAGFQNHVTKPIDPSELLAVVASLAPRSRRG